MEASWLPNDYRCWSIFQTRREANSLRNTIHQLKNSSDVLVDAERERRLNIMFPIDSAIGAAAGVPISLTNIHDVGASKLWKDGYETLAKTGQCSIGRETVGKCTG